MLRRWALLASFYQALVNALKSVNIFTVCQKWLLTNYFRLAKRNIWITELPSYPGLYFHDSKLCICRHPVIFLLPHLRQYWQPHNQGGRREGARECGLARKKKNPWQQSQSKAAAGEWWQQSRRSKEGEVASEPDVKPCRYGVYLLDVQRYCLLPNQVIPSTMRHIIQCTDSFSTFGCWVVDPFRFLI